MRARWSGWVIFGLLFSAGSSSAALAQGETETFQPIIDMHRHTPWPGQSDSDGLSQIRAELASHGVVASMLFITGREDVEFYRSEANPRLVLSPMFPCPPLTDSIKWCATEEEGLMPDPLWLEEQVAAGTLAGIGELVFNYSGMAPADPAMLPFWEIAARHDVPAFVHTGRGPDPGEGPRRHPNCCASYDEYLGNPDLLRPILQKFPNLRVSLQHVGFDYMDETIGLLREYPNVFLDMSVLNSVGPNDLYIQSLRRLLDAGLSERIMFGSDDQDMGTIIERLEQAQFLTDEQRRGIYYDNAARFLRLDKATIERDHQRN